MPTTVYVIWPDGVPFRHTIRSRIERCGLNIAESRLLRIHKSFFNSLYPLEWYPTITPEVRARLHQLTTDAESEVGIVEGPGAIKKLLLLSGRYSDPALCEAGTIRNDFGASTIETIGEFKVHLKVIHRPQHGLEARRDTRLVRHLLTTATK